MSIERAADTAAAVSLPAWLVSWAVATLPIIQWLAGFIAIVAGGFAIYVHIKKIREK
jgi:hypothetical protein